MKTLALKVLCAALLATPLAARANVDELIKKATAADPELKKLTEEIAGKHKGCIAKMGPIKEKARIEEKAKNDYKGDVNQVLDICRSTVECPKNADVLAVEHLMDHDYAKHIARKKDKWTTPTPVEYRDFTYNLKMSNGATCELQINSKPMVDAKKIGHEMYKVIRSLENKKENECDQDCFESFIAAIEGQISLYKHAYEQGK